MFYLYFRLQNKIFRERVSNEARESHKPVGHVMRFRPSLQSVRVLSLVFFFFSFNDKRRGCSFRGVSHRQERMISFSLVTG